MKKINKLMFKKISDSLSQFLSLVVISAIGIAMYVGILSVGSTMQTNALTYFEKQHLSAIQIDNPYGFSDKEIDYLKKQKDLDVLVSTTLDVSLIHHETNKPVKMMSMGDQNIPYLINGELVKNGNNNNDCYYAGSKNDWLDKDIELEFMDQKQKCRVVGQVSSPLYMSDKYFGYSTKDVGEIENLVLVSDGFIKEMFKNFPYINTKNTIAVSYKNDENPNIFNKKYQESINNKIDDLKKHFDSNATFTPSFDNTGISSFENDSSQVAQIAAIFPVIFFLVAAFVSTSTMSRMISEERSQAGILLALGYHKRSIIRIYTIYALISAVAGSIIGVLIGVLLIPNTVMATYSNLYFLPYQDFIFNWNIIFQSVFIILILMVVSTWIVAFLQMKSTCANLLRPKAPPAGKKIFLENIDFIWKRFSFINKVSIRNLFLYKKRLLMSILAITGCSALLITGFGVKSSVDPLLNLQFKEINNFNLIGYVDDSTKNQIEEYKKQFKDSDVENKSFTIRQNASAKLDNDTFDFTFITPSNNDEFNNLIHLNKDISKDNSVIITNKLAANLNLKKGDNLKFKLNNKNYTLKITDITKQYIGNYLYVDSDTYKKEIGPLMYNSFLANSSDISKTIGKLENKDFIRALMDQSNIYDTMEQSFSGLNNVVFIMIGFAAVLAITVMYTLNNINLAERSRELATLKVLGFYTKEVNHYLLKETIVLTILGLIVGIVAGIFLHIYIMDSVELPDIYFIKEQAWYNYVLTIIITFFFTFIVNLFTKARIKKIDMVSSLKSAE